MKIVFGFLFLLALLNYIPLGCVGFKEIALKDGIRNIYRCLRSKKPFSVDVTDFGYTYKVTLLNENNEKLFVEIDRMLDEDIEKQSNLEDHGAARLQRVYKMYFALKRAGAAPIVKIQPLWLYRSRNYVIRSYCANVTAKSK